MPGELQFISHQRHTVFFRIQCYRICFKNSPISSKCSNHLWDPPSYPANFGLPQRHCFLAHATMERTTCNEAASLKTISATVASVIEWWWRFPGIGLCRSQAHTPDGGSTCPLKWGELHQESREVGPYWRSLNVIGIIWRWCKVLRELQKNLECIFTSNTKWHKDKLTYDQHHAKMDEQNKTHENTWSLHLPQTDPT